jgi:hypothetical protein
MKYLDVEESTVPNSLHDLLRELCQETQRMRVSMQHGAKVRRHGFNPPMGDFR